MNLSKLKEIVEFNIINEINSLINQAKSENVDTSRLSDGYHTFKELYDMKKAYNVALFNEWASQKKYKVHKSFKHNDGSGCFDGNWFIVVALLPNGQISNYYHKNDWDLFIVPEVEKALFEFDGHQTKDVIERLLGI